MIAFRLARTALSVAGHQIVIYEGLVVDVLQFLHFIGALERLIGGGWDVVVANLLLEGRTMYARATLLILFREVFVTFGKAGVLATVVRRIDCCDLVWGTRANDAIVASDIRSTMGGPTAGWRS